MTDFSQLEDSELDQEDTNTLLEIARVTLGNLLGIDEWFIENIPEEMDISDEEILRLWKAVILYLNHDDPDMLAFHLSKLPKETR